ncbi:MAG: DUF4340 domain-containing protein [Deltaproteobacteria bacterium]|nr:DUF4340 domain-containing protein [Deltaproteobacteria bacterium]
MKRTPIIVVAVLFVVEVLVLAFATPRPPASQVRAETLALGDDYTGVTLTIDRPAPEQAEPPEAPTPPEDDLLGTAPAPAPAGKEGREVVELAYEGGKWLLRKPLEFPASKADIDRLVENLKNLDLAEVPTTSAREELGLDDKQGVRITASRDGRPVVDLIVGNTVEGRTFVRKPDDAAIWTVEGLGRDELVRPVDELREHQIFELEATELTQITVARGRGEKTFVQREKIWGLEPADENWLVDAAKVAGAAGALARLRAVSFADDPSTEVTGLGGLFAGAMITFVSQPEGKTPTTYKVLVGNLDETKENYYVMRADPGAPAPETVYLVSKYNVERVIGSEATGLDEYRERRVVRDIASDQVQTVAVSLGGTTVSFTKGEGTDAWNPAAGSPFSKADGATLAATIRKLGTLRADDFVAMPGLRVGERAVTLKELVENFPQDIRDAMAMGSGGDSVGQLELANVLTQNSMFLEQMAGLYAVIYPETAAAAAAGIRTLAGELQGTFTSLRDPLLALAAKVDGPSQGVPVRWTFTTADGKTLNVQIGGTTPDGKRPVYTDTPGDRQVYLIGADKLGDLLLEDLNDLRVPRLLGDVPADRVTTAFFSNAGRSWTFQHPIGGAWSAASGTAVPNLDPDKLASHVRRVLELEAVKFVRSSAEAAGLATPTAVVRLTWTPEPPAAAEGAPPPAPGPMTVTIEVGGEDAEGQRWVRLTGLDPLLDTGIFLVAKGPAADLLFEASNVAKVEAGVTTTPTTPPVAAPGEDLANLLGGGAPAPAPAPEPPPAPATP